MKVLHTLVRTYPNGKTSTWKFGRLADGTYVAKGMESGAKRWFKSLAHMQHRMRYLTWSVGFNEVKPSKQLVLNLG